MLGAYDALGQDSIECGLIITKSGHLELLSVERMGLVGVEAGYPLPNKQSLDAGWMLLEFLSQQPADHPFPFFDLWWDL